MNKFKIAVSIAACKLSRKLIRLLGRGGTDMPGKIAMKFCPDLLKYLASDVEVLIVTGTNGKTTSSRMLEQCLIDSGKSYIANKTGANLLTGITAEFANHATLGGKVKADYALIEADEAAFKMVGKYTDPKYVLVTNVFRDQRDRCGEITHRKLPNRYGHSQRGLFPVGITQKHYPKQDSILWCKRPNIQRDCRRGLRCSLLHQL